MNQFEIIFEESPISIWEEDCSNTKKILDKFIGNYGIESLPLALQNDDYLNELIYSIKITRVNKKTLEIFKANYLSELSQLEKVLCEESKKCFREQMMAIAKGDLSYEGECCNISITGDAMYFFLKWKIYNNNYSQVLVSLVDITALKQAESKLHNINEKYKNLIERTETSYIILNEKLEIKESNNVFEKLIGYPKECLVNMPIWKLFPPNDKTCEKAIYTLTSACCSTDNNEKPISMNVLMLGNNNKLIWTDVVISKFINGSTKIFCLIRDVSSKKVEELAKYIDKQKQKDKMKQNIYRIRNCLQRKSMVTK